jgi:hypothetical protein
VLVAGLLLGVVLPAPAGASCQAPTITVATNRATGTPASWPGTSPSATPVLVAAGELVTVSGEYFFSDCFDTISCTGGCSACTGGGTAPAMLDLRLVLVSGTTATELGRQDATADRGEVRWDVDLPTSLAPGAATLEVRRDGAAVVSVPLLVSS